MAGKKKKQKTNPSSALLLSSMGPSYSIANTSSEATSTTTTTVNKTPLLMTTTSGGNDHHNSISFFDSISSIDKRIAEGDGDTRNFDFEELSAVINGKSNDIDSCFGSPIPVVSGHGKNAISKTQSKSTNNNNSLGNQNYDRSSFSDLQSVNDQRNNNKSSKKPSDTDDNIRNANSGDELFPKIVKVCSLAASYISNKSKTSKEDESDTKFMKPQYSLLGDGSNYNGMYTRENGSNNSSSTGGGFDDDEDDTLIGSDYPEHENHYYDLENAGHFLTGSGGFDSLSKSSDSSSFDGGASQIPDLACCSTIWDGIINICEISTCSKSANKKCGLCKSAYYCSEEHQRLDWRKHRNECIPYKLNCVSEGVDGPISAMAASRDIPEGKTVFSEKPLLVLPIANFCDNFAHVMEYPCTQSGGKIKARSCQTLKPPCLGCLTSIETDENNLPEYRCSKCSLPLCSAKCEYAMEHQNFECNAIVSCGGLSSNEFWDNCMHCVYMDVEILRALQLGCYGNPNGEWETFLGLKNNIRVEAYRHTEQFYTFVKYMKTLVPFSAKVSRYNYDLISDVHSIITALAFKPSLESPFKCVFGTQLLFLHSCIPNTFHFIENVKTCSQHQMKLITKSAVSILAGEPISIDFVPTPFLPYRLRKRYLNNLYIACRCNRCIRPFDGDHSGDIKCPHCRDGVIRAESPLDWEDSVWSCHRCQEEFPYNNVRKLENESNYLLSQIPKSRAGIPALLEFIEERQALLNPTHSLLITAWSHVEAVIRTNIENVREPNYLKKYNDDTLKEFQILARYCDVIGPHIDFIRQGLWIDKGIILFQKFYAHFALASCEFQTKRIIRKEYIQRVLRAMKALQSALQHLITFYEGSDTPKYVARLIQEGTYALSSLKEFIGHMIMKDAAETSNSTRVTPSTNL